MSAKKFDTEKAPISLIPHEAIIEEARALGYGAGKYGRDNFRSGIEYTRLIDAALRHIFAIADGEDIDEESGCYHAACARANLGMLIYMTKNHPDKDNRPVKKILNSNDKPLYYYDAATHRTFEIAVTKQERKND